MGITLPFARMTTVEKLAETNCLWDDLCRSPEDVPSPAWHEAVLAESERLAVEGKMSFIDLGRAKERIREAAR